MKEYWLDPPEYPDPPECPVCGSVDYSVIYENDDGIVGCDDCIAAKSAEDYWKELEEDWEPDPDLLYEMRREMEWEENHEQK